MIFSYSESGTIEINGQNVSALIDTDSPEYKARAAQLAERTGTVYLGTMVTTAQNPNDPTPNFTGTAQFRLEKADPVGVDAFNVRYTFITALAGIAGPYGLNIVLRDYEEPKPAPLPEDWNHPGAKIGPPLPGQPGRFSSRHDGSTPGTVWVGPSGRRYRLKQEGFGPLQMLVWILEV